MPSVAMENVNSEYSILLLLLIIIFAISGNTKFLTQYAYFLCPYIEAYMVTIVAKIAIVKETIHVSV